MSVFSFVLVSLSTWKSLQEEQSVFRPNRGAADQQGACERLVERHGFWGPWLNLTTVRQIRT